jgi:hypothetical protein
MRLLADLIALAKTIGHFNPRDLNGFYCHYRRDVRIRLHRPEAAPAKNLTTMVSGLVSAAVKRPNAQHDYGRAAGRAGRRTKRREFTRRPRKNYASMISQRGDTFRQVAS